MSKDMNTFGLSATCAVQNPQHRFCSMFQRLWQWLRGSNKLRPLAKSHACHKDHVCHASTFSDDQPHRLPGNTCVYQDHSQGCGRLAGETHPQLPYVQAACLKNQGPQLDQQPSQLDQQPSQLDQQPIQLDQQPSQLDQQPIQLDQQPSQLDQQPSQLGQGEGTWQARTTESTESKHNFDDTDVKAKKKRSAKQARTRTKAGASTSCLVMDIPQGGSERKRKLFRKAALAFGLAECAENKRCKIKKSDLLNAARLACPSANTSHRSLCSNLRRLEDRGLVKTTPQNVTLCDDFDAIKSYEELAQTWRSLKQSLKPC